MSKGKGITGSKFGWLLLLVILFAVNLLSSMFHTRFDLTKEKRYTLSRPTRELLKKLNDDVQIEIFLKGEFPSGFRKLANSTSEFLQLIKDENGARVHTKFVSPLDPMPGTRITYGDSLRNMGAIPINLNVQTKSGESNNIIFPVAVISYRGRKMLINLLPGANRDISQTQINSAESLMEYQFANAIDKLTQEKKPALAYAVGNGEPTDARTFDLVQTIRQDYQFGTFDLKNQPRIPDAVNVLLIVKPTEAFDEDEKFKIDQFVMRGGKLLCFIDNLNAEQDSLSYGKTQIIAYDRNLNLTDLFFRYGLRINTDLVMDLRCDVIPFIVGGTPENPQFEFLPWNYYPLLSPASEFSKSMGYVSSRFVNSIDTIQVPGVTKTPLLVSSENSRIISTPAMISLNENKITPQDEKYKRQYIPVAMMLEGSFSSLYKNRVSKIQMDTLAAHGDQFIPSISKGKVIVVADGDIAFNEVIPDIGPLPMGWNRYTYSEVEKQTENSRYFIQATNRDFFLNCVESLVKDEALSKLRNKSIVLRLLDAKKLEEGKTRWQLINIALPVLLVILAGFIYQQVRKRKYAS